MNDLWNLDFKSYFCGAMVGAGAVLLTCAFLPPPPSTLFFVVSGGFFSLLGIGLAFFHLFRSLRRLKDL